MAREALPSVFEVREVLYVYYCNYSFVTHCKLAKQFRGVLHPGQGKHFLVLEHGIEEQVLVVQPILNSLIKNMLHLVNGQSPRCQLSLNKYWHISNGCHSRILFPASQRIVTIQEGSHVGISHRSLCSLEVFHLGWGINNFWSNLELFALWLDAVDHEPLHSLLREHSLPCELGVGIYEKL